MKVLLIDPKFPQIGRFTGMPPFALLCVATYLHEKGKEVELLDMNAENLDYDELPQVIREKKPDIVGVPSSMTCFIPNSFQVCKIVKSVDPKIVTLGGGINFTAATKFYMERCPELDFVIRGDGEATIIDFVEALENGEKDLSKMEGLAGRKDGEIFVNSERFVKDMDSLPFTKWELLDLDKYNMLFFPPKWGKQIQFTISRGCPYSCNYCVATRGQGHYRSPSVDWAVEAVRRLRYKYGRRMLYTNDLCFGVNTKWSEAFFKKLIEEKIDVNMCIDMRCDQIIRQKHLLPLMREAGVRVIATGVESNLEKDEEKYQKKAGGNTPAGVSEEAVKLVKKAGIETWNFFMMGAPDHSPEDIAKIFHFADKLDPEVPVFIIPTPLPGTPYYEQMKKYIFTDDLSLYTETQPVMKNSRMTPQELMVLYAEVWVAYHAKIKRVIRGILSGEDTFRGWYYRKLYKRSKRYGSQIRYLQANWPTSPEEYKRLKKWAKKTLGAGNPIERALQFLMFQVVFRLLKRTAER